MAALSVSMYQDRLGFYIALMSTKTSLDFAVGSHLVIQFIPVIPEEAVTLCVPFILIVWVHDVCIGGVHITQSTCAGQRTTLGSGFSIFPHCVRSPRDGLSILGLVAGTELFCWPMDLYILKSVL